MRLGGPVFKTYAAPEQWAAIVTSTGFRAAYCPVGTDADDATVRAYAEAADRADVVIAEVGAWSNPISDDEKTRTDAHTKCRRSLDLADRIGARCCVNIAGSRGETWDGPHPENLTPETFDMIVESIRDIVDSVAPSRTFYTIETMPWIYPDSADSYLELLQAIDRKSVAVHCDPVNLINSPSRCYRTGEIVKDFFAKLGPFIKSCHAKDITLRQNLTVHLDEVLPGTGNLDYRVYLNELEKLDHDVPLMFEHLQDEGEYVLAAEFVRTVALGEEITL